MKMSVLRVSLLVRKLNVNIRMPCVDYNLNYTFSLTNQSVGVSATNRKIKCPIFIHSDSKINIQLLQE